MTSRAAQAVPLLLQSPPGQVPNVYEDLLGLVGADGASVEDDVSQYKALASTARAEYNLEQLVVVDVAAPGEASGSKAVLCKSAVHPNDPDRFLAPRSKVAFKVNHETLATSDARSYKPNDNVEPFRAELEKLISLYIQDKYATGVAEVFAVPLPRQRIEVKEEVKEQAMQIDVQDAQAGPGEAGSTAMEADNGDGSGGETKEEQGGRSTSEGDTKVEADEPQDDPVEVAKAAEEVQESMPEADAAPAESNAGKGDDIDEETHGDTQIVVHIVANKYKLSNFWSGRWRSSFTLESPTATEIEAHANIQVHYFEEGNVQLHTRKAEKLALDSSASGDDTARAKSVVRAIQNFEDEYQQELFRNSAELGEGAFKALRRQLPMTRQKIDWDKVLNYKLGSELSKQ